MTIDVDSLLARLVSDKWKGLTEAAFRSKYEDEVRDSLDEDLQQEPLEVKLQHLGMSELHLLPGGLVAVRSQAGRWSLFETAARVAERDHIRAWAEFARGTWVDKIPTEEGWFFCRDAGGRRRLHEFRRVRGRLLDVSGGFVSAGKSTEFVGMWWSCRLPGLPESW